MLSKAFPKSMKFIITDVCHAITFLVMVCLRAKIWSLHDLPAGLNHACFFRKYVSTLLLNLFSTTILISSWR